MSRNRNHNHFDRGRLHSDCPACALLSQLMDKAGLVNSFHDVLTVNGPMFTSVYSLSASATEELDRVNTASPPIADTSARSLLVRHLHGAHNLPWASDHYYASMLAQHHSLHVDQPFDATHYLGDDFYLHTDVPRRYTARPKAFAPKVSDPDAHRAARARQRTIQEVKGDSGVNRRRKAAPTLAEGIDGLTLKVRFQPPLTLALAHLEVVDSPLDAPPFLGVGVALCKPGDRFDDDLGAMLATGRALQQLGAQLVSCALTADALDSR